LLKKGNKYANKLNKILILNDKFLLCTNNQDYSL
jgi:hypothetical protein